MKTYRIDFILCSFGIDYVKNRVYKAFSAEEQARQYAYQHLDGANAIEIMAVV